MNFDTWSESLNLPENRTIPFRAAYRAALLCPGVGGRKGNNFRLGACIVHKKKILAVKTNSYKTHPKLAAFYKWPFCHAESAAILSVGIDNCKGKTLYVVRVKRNAHIAYAMPCAECIELIIHSGIKTVCFTTDTEYGLLLPNYYNKKLPL